MKNEIMASLVALTLMVAPVMAQGFEIHKSAIITGDWVWDTDHWTQPDPHPVTGTYQMDAISDSALYSGYAEPLEQLGTPWKYKLESHLYVDAPTEISNYFSVWTVNDPATTPATGGYTTYTYQHSNYGTYTHSHLYVTGEGACDISTYLNSQTETWQDVEVSVNE